VTCAEGLPEFFSNVLHYAVVFPVIALTAAVPGFGGIAAGAVSIAKLPFFVFVVLALVAFVASLERKPRSGIPKSQERTP
jgi:uncharacterized membrane protein YtjA (UPF0391 family)